MGGICARGRCHRERASISIQSQSMKAIPSMRPHPQTKPKSNELHWTSKLYIFKVRRKPNDAGPKLLSPSALRYQRLELQRDVSAKAWDCNTNTSSSRQLQAWARQRSEDSRASTTIPNDAQSHQGTFAAARLGIQINSEEREPAQRRIAGQSAKGQAQEHAHVLLPWVKETQIMPCAARNGSSMRAFV
jgi:hypothetical protein